jgi:hypothetical protein
VERDCLSNSCVYWKSKIRNVDDIVYSAEKSIYTGAKKIVLSVNNMQKCEMSKELQEQGCSTKGTVTELRKRLSEERKGVESLPAVLMFDENNTTLEDLGMNGIDIPCIEPMHCIKGHMENLLNEFSHKDYGTPANTVKEVRSSIFANKAQLRCRDYRMALPCITSALLADIGDHPIMHVFKTLSEMADIMYSPSYDRTSSSVLRLHNQVALHTIFLTRL